MTIKRISMYVGILMVLHHEFGISTKDGGIEQIIPIFGICLILWASKVN